jgi:hypothetical protein
MLSECPNIIAIGCSGVETLKMCIVLSELPLAISPFDQTIEMPLNSKSFICIYLLGGLQKQGCREESSQSDYAQCKNC